MDKRSIELRRRILQSYLRRSGSIIRIQKTRDNPSDYLSRLELHNFDKSIWIVGHNYYMINKGIKIDIPEGYCICFRKELNWFSRILFSGNYHRTILALVWFRDVMDYNVNDIRIVLNSVMECEEISKLTRSLLLLTLRLK